MIRFLPLILVLLAVLAMIGMVMYYSLRTRDPVVDLVRERSRLRQQARELRENGRYLDAERVETDIEGLTRLIDQRTKQEGG